MIKPEIPEYKKASRLLDWLKAHVDYDGDECLIWPFSKAGGNYAQIGTHKAHRVMCFLAHGPPPTDAEYYSPHTCKTHDCVSPKHVFWKRRKQNSKTDLYGRAVPITFSTPDSTSCPLCGSAIRSQLSISLESNMMSLCGRSWKLAPQMAEFMSVLNDAYPRPASIVRIANAVWGSLARTDEEDKRIYRLVLTYACIIRKMIKPMGLNIVSVRAVYGVNGGSGGYRLSGVGQHDVVSVDRQSQ